MGGFATLHFGLSYPQAARALVVAGCDYSTERDRLGRVPRRGRRAVYSSCGRRGFQIGQAPKCTSSAKVNYLWHPRCRACRLPHTISRIVLWMMYLTIYFNNC